MSNHNFLISILALTSTFVSYSEPSGSSDFYKPCNCEGWLDAKLVELPTLGYMMPQLYDDGCGISLFCRWDGGKKYDKIGVQTLVKVYGKEELQTYLFNGTAQPSWNLDKDFGVQCDEKSKKWKATKFPKSYKPVRNELPLINEQKIEKVLCYPKM